MIITCQYCKKWFEDPNPYPSSTCPRCLCELMKYKIKEPESDGTKTGWGEGNKKSEFTLTR